MYIFGFGVSWAVLVEDLKPNGRRGSNCWTNRTSIHHAYCSELVSCKKSEWKTNSQFGLLFYSLDRKVFAKVLHEIVIRASIVFDHAS